MVYVADDLGPWLVGVLADAGRRKLTRLVLGTEQERALRLAVTVAVQRTAGELRPGDEEQATATCRASFSAASARCRPDIDPAIRNALEPVLTTTGLPPTG